MAGKRIWMRWIGPGLLILILDRLIKQFHLWVVQPAFDMRNRLSEAPPYYQLLLRLSDGLGKAFSFLQGDAGRVQSVRNTGMAFGLFEGNSIVILIGSALLLLACVFLLRGTRPAGLAPVSLSLILGGAAGNMIDRLLYGYVIDMFPFFGWFVFNAADVGVVAGAILCGWSLLFRPQDWSGKEQ